MPQSRIEGAIMSKLKELRELVAKISEGPWDCGHMVNPTISCNCRYIFSNFYMGAICEITKMENENDNPPEDEAIANAKFIVLSRNNVPALLDLIETLMLAVEQADITLRHDGKYQNSLWVCEEAIKAYEAFDKGEQV